MMESGPDFVHNRTSRLFYAGALAGSVAALAACGGHNAAPDAHPPTNPNVPKPHLIHITEGLNAHLEHGNLIVFTHQALEGFLHSRKSWRSKVTVVVHNIHGEQYVSVQYGQGIAGGNVETNQAGDMAMECAPPKGDICELEVERTDIDLKNKATTTHHSVEVQIPAHTI